MTEVRSVAHEVQITIGGRIHRLTTLSASNDSLEFALLCTQLAARVFYFAEFLVRILGALVIVAGENGALLLRVVGALELLPLLDGLGKLFSPLAQVIIIEGWWILDGQFSLALLVPSLLC